MLFRTGAYSYGYMDEWERFKKASLPHKKKEFYSNINIEDIRDANYMHSNIVCKKVEIKNVGEYHDLNLKRDALLLADNFKNFKEMCLKS